MPSRPRVSLCIPTYNRAGYFAEALESGLREVASQAPGSVEILVCDNASTDETGEYLARAQALHPELQVFRNSQNLGFDLNYLRCVKEARGEFVWVMGDDDLWLPGSLARVLRELEAGADACLCLAEACDLDLNPLVILPWYLEDDPPRVWNLNDRKALLGYFDACARNAGVFAFISVSVFRRDRFLRNWESMDQAVAQGYPHLMAMAAYLREPLRLHYIPEALVRNRMSDLHANSYANNDLYGRLMQDFRGWAEVADAVFGDDPEVHDAFSRILGRNHQVAILPKLRRCVATEAEWRLAVPYLIRAGFTPIQIAAVDFGFQHLQGDRLPMPTLNSASLCLVDLPLVVRGARRIAILALGGLQNILDGASVLATLRDAGRVRCFCAPECAQLLDGFELQCVDPGRYAQDAAYRAALGQEIANFAPELAVNLDPERGIAGDDLVLAALPAGAIAFALPERGQDAALSKALDSAYACLIPRAAGPDALLAALDLTGQPATLWPPQVLGEEAEKVLENLGWDPLKTLALLVDAPMISEDPAFQVALAEAVNQGWNFVGIGGRGTYPLLESLLEPLEGRAVNLAGILSLGSMAALLGLCGGYLGGTPLLQSMARACGCASISPQASLSEG